MTFTVNSQNGVSRTTTILVRSTSASLGNGKAIGDLQWRRSDLATWNDMTLTDAQVEQRHGQQGPQRSLEQHDLLPHEAGWTTDAPATYAANYQVTLSQTVP